PASLSRAKTGRRLPKLAGAAQGTTGHGTGGVGTAVESPTFPDRSPPPTTCAGRKLRKNNGNSPKLTETSRPPISLLRPPFPSTQAPKARQNHRRDLQEFPASSDQYGKLDLVEDFGFRQNTGRLCRIFGKSLREV
ncbi:2-oxoglutarate and Fe(II)-dependent oxygenase superfamily protein, partial [Prunus dulcis]